MSAVVKCDGPGCTVTIDPEASGRRDWLTGNSPGRPQLDFHVPDCMAKWAAEQPPPVDAMTADTTVVDGR